MADEKIYHERQAKQFCALHSLNNLLQNCIFTKKQLDEICEKLSPSVFLNPHRSMLGIGNYDVNVMITALQTQNLELMWFDKRKKISDLSFENVFGFILNMQNKPNSSDSWHLTNLLHFFRSEKHWIAIRKINGQYWNLDSKLLTPKNIGNEEDLIEYLEQLNQKSNCEVFVITTKDNANNVFKQI